MAKLGNGTCMLVKNDSGIAANIIDMLKGKEREKQEDEGRDRGQGEGEGEGVRERE